MQFRNFYRCARCGHEWTDVWSATCDDDCPHCGARHMSPFKSEDADPDCATLVAQLVGQVAAARDRDEIIPDWLSELEDTAIELTKDEGGDASDDQRPDPIEALKLA